MTPAENPGTILKRPRFKTDTPAQVRAFIALTLAQMVHLEDVGIPVTGKSARRQAFDLLEIPNTAEGRKIATDDLIARLRDRAAQAAHGGRQ